MIVHGCITLWKDSLTLSLYSLVCNIKCNCLVPLLLLACCCQCLVLSIFSAIAQHNLNIVLRQSLTSEFTEWSCFTVFYLVHSTFIWAFTTLSVTGKRKWHYMGRYGALGPISAVHVHVFAVSDLGALHSFSHRPVTWATVASNNKSGLPATSSTLTSQPQDP